MENLKSKILTILPTVSKPTRYLGDELNAVKKNPKDLNQIRVALAFPDIYDVGMSHLGLKTELTDQQRNYVSKVNRSGEALLALLNDILDLSKIEAGKLELEVSDFALSRVFEDVYNILHYRADEKGLKFFVRVADDVPKCLRGDPLRFS